jgi:hypothetical protein
MAMEKIVLKTVFFMFLLFISKGIQVQNAASNLSQLKLGQRFVGTWQQDVRKDSIEIPGNQQYGCFCRKYISDY